MLGKNKVLIDKIILCASIILILCIIYMCHLSNYNTIQPSFLTAYEGNIYGEPDLYYKHIILGDGSVYILNLLEIKEISDIIYDEIYVDMLDTISYDIVYSDLDCNMVVLKVPMGVKTCQLILLNISAGSSVKYVVLSELANNYYIEKTDSKDKLSITAFYRYIMQNYIVSENETSVVNINSLEATKRQYTKVFN